ncbi:long-chain fatty acid--CoA ligase [Kordiimonas sp. SCSIO 12610]|uniref:AMP-dependent synthetase/ligase n=1 Tax=Kordiimonas sp. SCSIO 12610 TaxID=2829597 RepID=UPI0021089DD6|nr:AMP-dependent synthetase/ligase [Kordiimonas sp. SCSIO 12610]UTW55540.1 long-chain fatty acid--CoA ligase [Kordiimonas sp. SCSIO 12610]
MPIKQWESLTAMFFEQVKTYADQKFLFNKQDKQWQDQTWQQIAEKVCKLATALNQLGVKKGDRVVLVSENRPEWLIADMAIMAAGAISVPTYTTYTARDYLHIIENSRASLALISTKSLANTFLKAAHQSDDLKNAIIIDDFKLEQSLNVEVHSWADLLSKTNADIDFWQNEAKSISREDIACLIYTSGTGGAPKGVKIHHGAILHNCEGAAQIIESIGLKNNVFLSFLPLSHAYEHTAGQFLPISIGAQIWYAEGIEKLANNMEEASPTIMVVVPRLFEMLRTRLTRQIEKESKLKQKLFNRCIEIGSKQAKGDEPLSLIEKITNLFLDLTVRKQVKKKFGGRVKALVSGGAPLSPDVGYFFTALGLPLLQGYGQTESGPVVSVNPPGAARMHTVGKILDKTKVKIADDGEILIQGELVMKGYWQNESATEKTIIDGWLHTGDIGKIDDGYLEITDRKKDILVNDKGDNISPQRIEGLLALEDEIAQAMVYGDRKPHLVGLIVPDTEWLITWAKKHNKPAKLAEVIDDSDFKKALANAVDRINNRLANVEKVRKFTIAHEAFSIENEQMTPTLKVRRHAVNSVYGDKLEALYKKP